MMQVKKEQFFTFSEDRPKPKAGYKCKICGKPGGKMDSHWYQLCPARGKTDDQRAFNPPRKGYMCKFCHKQGGDHDSHWFQQCPRRTEYEGIQVPHPLKVRGITSGMVNIMNPQQALAAQAAAVAMNIGVLPQMQAHFDYHPQAQYSAAATTLQGMFMYPQQQTHQQQQQQPQQMFFLQQHVTQQPADSVMMQRDFGAQSQYSNSNLSFDNSFIGRSNFGDKGANPSENDLDAFYQQQIMGSGESMNCFALGNRIQRENDPDLLSHITNRAQKLALDGGADESKTSLSDIKGGNIPLNVSGNAGSSESTRVRNL